MAQGGTVVYVICGDDGCPQRLVLAAAQWQAELRRRRRSSARLDAEEARHSGAAGDLDAAWARQRAIDARWAGRREEDRA